MKSNQPEEPIPMWLMKLVGYLSLYGMPVLLLFLGAIPDLLDGNPKNNLWAYIEIALCAIILPLTFFVSKIFMPGLYVKSKKN